MPYTSRPFQPDVRYTNQVSIELNKANDNFDILSQVFESNDPETQPIKVGKIPKIFKSAGVITPTANTVYQELDPCLIIATFAVISGFRISPNGTTWSPQFGEANSTSYNGSITIYIPPGWYWKYSSTTNRTGGGDDFFYKITFWY